MSIHLNCYHGSGFTHNWNSAWRRALDYLRELHEQLVRPDAPGPLREQSIAYIFWHVVDNHYTGQVPPQVAVRCPVPARPALDFDGLLLEYRKLGPRSC